MLYLNSPAGGDRAGKKQAVEKKLIIIYDSYDVGLAEALKQLFQHWGLDAFYFQQEDRADGESYRRKLREELNSADLAVLLLSREFEHSQYCQSEAGAVMCQDKPCIAIMVPPAVSQDVGRISPVLGDLQVLDGTDTIARIKSSVSQKAGPLTERHGSRGEEKRLVRAVEDRLNELCEAYALNPPSKILMGIWPSLTEESHAHLAIIKSIRNALAGRGKSPHVAFVGVSLKYSLRWITAALTDLPKSSPKELTIELVHMDDQSHILHALRDSHDIDSILQSFHTEWAATKAAWERYCAAAKVTLTVRESRIDYIPPRIGIFIDSGVEAERKLFAGRCAVKKVGQAFSLLVGEREYHHYTWLDERGRADNRGQGAIREFGQFLALYREPKYNGVVLVSSPTTWLEQLTSCVDRYQGLNAITLISDTMTKLWPLIVPALRRGLLVKIYARDPQLIPAEERWKVTSIPKRVREEILNDNGRCRGTVELRYYRHLSTFRAALIGEEALGIQMYVHRTHWDGDLDVQASPTNETRPSKLRFIVTRNSSQFQDLKADLIEQFLRCEGVDKDPVETISA
jgi:hypothetical protein